MSNNPLKKIDWLHVAVQVVAVGLIFIASTGIIKGFALLVEVKPHRVSIERSAVSYSEDDVEAPILFDENWFYSKPLRKVRREILERASEALFVRSGRDPQSEKFSVAVETEILRREAEAKVSEANEAQKTGTRYAFYSFIVSLIALIISVVPVLRRKVP